MESRDEWITQKPDRCDNDAQILRTVMASVGGVQIDFPTGKKCMMKIKVGVGQKSRNLFGSTFSCGPCTTIYSQVLLTLQIQKLVVAFIPPIEQYLILRRGRERILIWKWPSHSSTVLLGTWTIDDCWGKSPSCTLQEQPPGLSSAAKHSDHGVRGPEMNGRSRRQWVQPGESQWYLCTFKQCMYVCPSVRLYVCM